MGVVAAVRCNGAVEWWSWCDNGNQRWWLPGARVLAQQLSRAAFTCVTCCHLLSPAVTCCQLLSALLATASHCCCNYGNQRWWLLKTAVLESATSYSSSSHLLLAPGSPHLHCNTVLHCSAHLAVPHATVLLSRCTTTAPPGSALLTTAPLHHYLLSS